MTIAFLPWPTSIYQRSKSACDLHCYMVRSPSESNLRRHHVICIVCMLRDLSLAGPSSHRQYDSPTWCHCQSFRTLSFECCQDCETYSHQVNSSRGRSHLACGHELKRAERNLEVGGVRLKIEESSRDAGLKLRRARARWAVLGDLVEGAHVCGGCRYSSGGNLEEI